MIAVADQSPSSVPFDLAERASAFAAAARQSRRVRRLRWLLPLTGALLSLIIVVAGVVSRLEVSLSVGDLKITSAGLAMDSPKLSGSDGKGRTYLVTADEAVQNLSDTRVIRLTGIRAHVVQADGSSADLTSAVGVYNTGEQKLTLEKDIRITSSDGSSAALRQAVINLNDGSVISDGPVAFSSNLGQVEANGMGVTRKAGSVTFDGGVRMTLDPKAVNKQATPKGGAQTTSDKP